MYVYYEEFQGVNPPKVTISVKEGSMIPKDNMTLANQAIDLAMAGKLSLIDLYKKLEYPHPVETAANVWLEVNFPQLLYAEDPRVAQVFAMQQQAAMAPPGMSQGGSAPPQEQQSQSPLAQVPISPQS